MSNKKETLQESYERLYGNSPLFDSPSNSKSKVSSSSEIPINIVRFIFKLLFSGIHSQESIRNREKFMVISGLLMSSYSILGMVFMHDINNFFKSFGWSDGFLTIFMGVVGIFFLVQLSRGFSFMGGFHLFNTGYSNGGRSAAHFGVIHGASTVSGGSRSSKTNSSRSEIDGFIGYANSKMASMDNRAKEKYVKDLFGGSK